MHLIHYVKDFIETVFLSVGGQEIVGNDWIKLSKSSSQSQSSCMRHSSCENVTLSHKFIENNFKCYLFLPV